MSGGFSATQWYTLPWSLGQRNSEVSAFTVLDQQECIVIPEKLNVYSSYVTYLFKQLNAILKLTFFILGY